MADHIPERGLQRAQLAQRTGCNLETIRYYEKIGLLPAPPRRANGYRAYDESHVLRLRFIRRGRELGFAIEGLRGLLSLVDHRNQTCAEVKLRTERHLGEVRARIADLRRIEAVLAETAARCADDEVARCPILEVLFGDDASDGRLT